MSEPVYVTKVAERKWDWPWRHVVLPIFEPMPERFSQEYFEWEKRNGWRYNFSVHKDDLQEAKMLAEELWNLQKNTDSKKEFRIMERLMKIKTKDYNERTDVEKWEHSAIQIPGDIGGPNKKEIKRLLTKKSKGRVLETMCGFNSYFGESPQISEVIALDYCEAMLERYAYPERKRILYDLERIIKGEHMDFFQDESFQTVGCFGSNYLTDTAAVFTEFRRILSPNGKLLIVESTSEGYSDIIKRYFKPEECAEFMEKSGLSAQIKHLPLKKEWELGEYFLVEGRKKSLKKDRFD